MSLRGGAGSASLQDAGAPALLGVVLAGGMSSRFGGEKALHELAGKPMAAWTLEALRPWTAMQVVVANDPTVYGVLQVPGRPDVLPGRGPLGGVLTGLAWAREEGLGGAFVLACDLPLVAADLVGRILSSWPPTTPVAVPESPGPLGFEPLCAGYLDVMIPVVEEILAEGPQPVDAALKRVRVHRVPAPYLGTREELVAAFTNVNTRESARWCESVLRDRMAHAGGEAGRSA